MDKVRIGVLLAAAGLGGLAAAAEFDVKFCNPGSSARLVVSGRQVVLTEEAAGEIDTIKGTILQGGPMTDEVAGTLGKEVDKTFAKVHGLVVAFEGADSPRILYVAETKSSGAWLIDGAGRFGDEILGTDKGCR